MMATRNTSTPTFRERVNEVAMLPGYEVIRDLELTSCTIETPLETVEAPVAKGN